MAVHGLALLLGRNEAGISNGENFIAPRCISKHGKGCSNRGEKGFAFKELKLLRHKWPFDDAKRNSMYETRTKSLGARKSSSRRRASAFFMIGSLTFSSWSA